MLTVVMPGTAYLMIGMAWMMLLCALANALPVVRFILVPGAALLTTVVMALLVTPAVYLGHLAMGVEALHLCMAVAALAMLGVFAGWGMLICKVKPIQKKIHDERGSARYEA